MKYKKYACMECCRSRFFCKAYFIEYTFYSIFWKQKHRKYKSQKVNKLEVYQSQTRVLRFCLKIFSYENKFENESCTFLWDSVWYSILVVLMRLCWTIITNLKFIYKWPWMKINAKLVSWNPVWKSCRIRFKKPCSKINSKFISWDSLKISLKFVS